MHERPCAYYIRKSATYSDDSVHQHIFRSEFYEALASDGQITLAQRLIDFINGTLDRVGP